MENNGMFPMLHYCLDEACYHQYQDVWLCPEIYRIHKEICLRYIMYILHILQQYVLEMYNM